MEIKILCHEKDCLEWKRVLNWNGKFIENWFCDNHKQEIKK